MRTLDLRTFKNLGTIIVFVPKVHDIVAIIISRVRTGAMVLGVSFIF